MKTKNEEIKQKIDDLREQLHKWNYEYYVLNQPTVDDYTFDQKLKELEKLEFEHPEFADPNSPTVRVGGQASDKFIKHLHHEPMLSLENSYNLNDITSFVQNIIKQTKETELDFICEPKIDGLSISCVYQDGKLQYALTRGDGKEGEDVTANVKTINTIPLTIPYLQNFEARGEVYMPKHVLLQLNEADMNFMNTRNTASGALRNLDPKVTRSRHLSAWFYYIPLYLDEKFKTQEESLHFLAQNHFPVALDVIKKVHGIDGIMQYIDWFEKQRRLLDYDVDGVVIKLNDRSLYPLLGTTSKFPKFAIAYKYPPTIAQTKLTQIITDVGRTGKISFTAKLIPVKINGSVIEYATLHNADYIKDRDIQLNDYVNIYKAAEVIPKISNPIISMRHDDVRQFEIPNVCPVCHTLLVKRGEEEVDLYCPNPNCKGKIIAQLVYFCSKECMDIQGLSDATINKFYDHHFLTNILDLYHLKDHYDEIIELDLHIKHKSLNKILDNITKSKELSLEHILTGLGIMYVGIATSTVLAKHFNNIDNLINASMDELLEIKDIGDKVASAIYNYFRDNNNLTLINSLKDLGVNFTYKKPVAYATANANSPFFGKTFAVTGKFDEPRDELVKLIEQKYFGKVVTNITKSTNYLVLGKDPSSKLEKAKEWGIKIISEKELKEEND